MMKQYSLLLFIVVFISCQAFAQNSNKVKSASYNKSTKINTFTTYHKVENTVQRATTNKNISTNNKAVQSNNKELKRLLDNKVIRWAKKPNDSIQLAERDRLLKAKVLQWAPNKTNRSSQLINEN